MRRHTQIYVTAAATLALFGTWVLVRASPNVPGPMLTDALLLCCLAVTAEFLGYVLPRSAAGSIGFIPYFAAAIIVPGWPSVLAVMIVKSAVELWARRPVLKAVLNVSAHAIAELLVVFGYTMLGGVALRLVPNYHNLADVTRAAATPALVAFIVASLANNLLVTGAIALSSGRSVGEVLRGNHNRANGSTLYTVPWRQPRCGSRFSVFGKYTAPIWSSSRQMKSFLS